MHRSRLLKPDGRELFLYSRTPIASLPIPPVKREVPPTPHLRWHPFRGEWVAYGSYRQHRVFLPPTELNPFAPTRSQDSPTELPAGDYDVAVFENLSPVLGSEPPVPPDAIVSTQKALGRCEVVVYTQNEKGCLASLPLWHIELLLEVWADRHRDLGARKEILYVMPFENRGVEVGVTLHHPHGQIYAYPWIPPIPARELEQQLQYWTTHGRGLLEDHIERELRAKERILFESIHSVAFVPAFARYPYEVWVAPIRPVSSAADLESNERSDLAKALKTVLLKYEGLWKRPFPYLMVLHSAPTDNQEHPEAHFHIEFYPPFRSPDKIKFLAGTELGAGLFANDSLPEEKAHELKKVEVTLE